MAQKVEPGRLVPRLFLVCLFGGCKSLMGLAKILQWFLMGVEMWMYQWFSGILVMQGSREI